jgi:hypothetical protein
LGHLGQGCETALRSFFRFLRITEKCSKELDLYLIRRRTYRLARVPRTVSVDELYRLFEDVKGNSPAAIRDRAVLLLITLYGSASGRSRESRWTTFPGVSASYHPSAKGRGPGPSDHRHLRAL